MKPRPNHRTSGGGNATVDTAPGKAMQEIRDAPHGGKHLR
jgi:hypothetical protein